MGLVFLVSEDLLDLNKKKSCASAEVTLPLSSCDFAEVSSLTLTSLPTLAAWGRQED
jgi:hypothetical protein